MDLNSLKCFLMVAEEKNITKASKRLFLTQQTLSSTIQRLETECGVQLLERKPTLRLTQAGETFLLYAKQIVNSENELHNALADIDRNCSTTLRVGMSQMRSDQLFLPVYERFHEKHPNVALSVYTGRTDEFYRLLSTGEISLFLGVNAEQRNGFVRRAVAEEHLGCAISLKLLQKYHPELTVEDMKRFVKEGLDPEMLKGIPCIRQRADSGRGSFGLEHYLYNALVECDYQGMLVKMVKAGVGYGCIFPYFFNEPVNRENGDLWFMPLRAVVHPFTISLVYRDQDLPEYMKSYIEILEQVIKEYSQYVSKLLGE